MTKAIITQLAQEQMEQAVECFNAGIYPAAAEHYEECARLMRLLEETRAAKKILQEEPTQQKQITLNV